MTDYVSFLNDKTYLMSLLKPAMSHRSVVYVFRQEYIEKKMVGLWLVNLPLFVEIA